MRPENEFEHARKLPRTKVRGSNLARNHWQAKPPCDPSDFNHTLLSIWPKERGTWFMAVWEPGEPGDPVERWVLYEMCPIDCLDPEIAAEFKGADPATLTRYDRMRDLVIPMTSITRGQWRLYHETGACGRMAWVVQGSNGGHKRFYTQLERRILRLLGRPSDAPAPGDLPYAPLDQRVLDQLIVHDRMRKHASSTDAVVRIGAMSREDGQRELRKYLVKWLGEQSEEWDPDAHRRDAASKSGTRRIDRQWDADYEKAAANYIEHGVFTTGESSSRIHLLR